MRLPNLGNLFAGISLSIPAIASGPRTGERRRCRLPRRREASARNKRSLGTKQEKPRHEVDMPRGISIRMETATAVCRFAFQGRVSRAHFDWNAPPVLAATTVVDRNLPI